MFQRKSAGTSCLTALPAAHSVPRLNMALKLQLFMAAAPWPRVVRKTGPWPYYKQHGFAQPGAAVFGVGIGSGQKSDPEKPDAQVGQTLLWPS